VLNQVESQTDITGEKDHRQSYW